MLRTGIIWRMDEKGLGDRLQTARRKAGYTQQQLCQKSGLSYSTLAKIERGAIKSPSIFTIQQIAEALNTTVDVLLAGNTTQLAKKRSKTGISFVYFDVNGCMVRFFQQAFTAVAKDIGVSPDLIETTFWHFNDEVCRGDMSMDEFNKKLAQTFGVPQFDWQPYYLDTVKSIAETVEIAEWVASHYKIGLMSNIMPGFLDAMRANGTLPNIDFDAIVDSSEAKAIKPEAKIYEIAAQKAGCKPTEILLIDDSRANLMAAEKQGWHVLWFDGYAPQESVRRIEKALEF